MFTFMSSTNINSDRYTRSGEMWLGHWYKTKREHTHARTHIFYEKDYKSDKFICYSCIDDDSNRIELPLLNFYWTYQIYGTLGQTLSENYYQHSATVCGDTAVVIISISCVMKYSLFSGNTRNHSSVLNIKWIKMTMAAHNFQSSMTSIIFRFT